MAANSWRPDQWQERGHPPAPWASRTEQFAPPTRPHSQRAMSNTEPLDPRRRARSGDPRKRPPSQSPERARPPKQARSDHAAQTASLKDAAGSRRSSLPNGAAARAGAPRSNTRMPSTQLKADFRKEAEGGMRSPIGAPSTNKEPETSSANPILEALQKFSSQVATQASLEIGQRQADQLWQRACAEYKELKSKFQNFPALEEKKNRARVQAFDTLERARQDLQKHVSAQNEIMENLASLIGSVLQARPEEEPRTDSASHEELASLKTKHEDIIQQHNTLSSTVNTLQGKVQGCEQHVAAVQGTADGAANTAASSLRVSKDAIRTAEEAKKAAADAAGAVHGTKTEVAAASESVKEVKTDAERALSMSSETKRIVENAASKADNARDSANNASLQVTDQVSRLQNRVDDVMNDVKRLTERKADGESGGPENDKHAADEVKTKIEAFREELAAFKTETSTQYAPRKDVGDLESRIDTLAQDVAGARKVNTTLVKDVEQIKSTKSSSNASEEFDTQYKSRVDELWQHQIWQDGPKLAERIEGLEQKIAETRALTIGDKAEAIDTVRGFVNLLGWVNSHKQDLELLRDKFFAFTDNVEEDGKGTVKERFKKIDRAVNDLSILVGGDGKTTMPQRITTVEKMLDDLKQSVETARSATVNAFSSQTSLMEGEIRSQQTETHNDVYQGKLIARVPALEQKYDALRKEIEDMKSSVGTASHSNHATFSEDVDRRLQDVERILRGLDELQEKRDNIVLDLVDEKIGELRDARDGTSMQNQGTQDEILRLENAVTEVRANLERLEKSVQAKVGQEAFDQGLTATIQPVRDSINKLQGHVVQLQAQKMRQTSMSAPETPPIFGQPPQMPNGIDAPHLNGPPQRVSTPQVQPIQDVSRLQNQIDGIIMAQQHLKQRCDNLVTDDVVRSMVDQMSIMYPDAKNFNSAHKALAKKTDALEGEIRTLKQSSAGRPGEMHAVRTRVDGVEKAMREANVLAKRMEQDVAGLKSSTNTLSTAAKAMSPTPAPATSVAPADFTALCERVDEIGKVAIAADVLSKGHGSRFSNLGLNTKRMNDLTEMENIVKKHTGEIDNLAWKQGQLEKNVDSLGAETVKATAAVEAMEKYFKT